MTQPQKTKYEAPKLLKIGTFEAITQGKSNGVATDAVFPIGTLPGAITFS